MIDNRDGQAYLDAVLEKIRQRILSINESLLEGQKEIDDMHEYYWQNYTEMDEYGYENFDNQQALLHQINANQEQLILKHRFRKMLDSPFFGRVDFCYEGDEEPEIFYIGIGNFAEKTGALPLIYDWRSPVSGLFYDYDKGPASYQAPMGELSGEITAKWQYKIRRGKMIYAFESDTKIDDEILKAELGSHGEVQLKNIIRTIQKEQNAIIRNTSDKILVIQGAAGSGKTSVALHRIAYLLYHDRKHLKSSNILILSPNGVFSDYISHILPELGEENIQEMSFDLFAYRQLKGTAADCEDRCDQIERNLLSETEDPVALEKQSQRFISHMEGFLLRLEDELMDFTPVEYKNVTMTEAEMLDLFYNKFGEIPLLSRMDAVADTFIDEVETLKNKDLPEEEKQELIERFRQMYDTRDFYVLYNRFLEEEGLPLLPDLPPEERKLAYEDVYPILYLKYRLQKRQGRQDIKHLVVDEMQDYSRLQYLILKQMFSCRMTILGDRAQTMADEKQDSLTFLPKIFGKDIRRIVMNKSYRNTVEISSYANALTGVDDVELFDRHEKPVTEQNFASLVQALDAVVQELRLDPELVAATSDENAPASENSACPDEQSADNAPAFETAAVILRTAAEAEQAYEILREKLSARGFDVKNALSLLHRDSTTFRKGLTVTTFYLAKGLEFDQVFSIFPSKDQRPLVRQARYIAATRALHELYAYEIQD